MGRLYAAAVEQVMVATYDGRKLGPQPEACPFTLEQLLTAAAQAMQTALASAV